MTYKHCSVIDRDGFQTEFVLVVDGVIQYYTLKNGETLVDGPPSLDLLRPRWNGTEWLESASPEELAAREAEQAALTRPALPTIAERLEAVEEALTDILMGGIHV